MPLDTSSGQAETFRRTLACPACKTPLLVRLDLEQDASPVAQAIDSGKGSVKLKRFCPICSEEREFDWPLAQEPSLKSDFQVLIREPSTGTSGTTTPYATVKIQPPEELFHEGQALLAQGDVEGARAKLKMAARRFGQLKLSRQKEQVLRILEGFPK